MGKVIYTKYSKHCPYTVAHTIDCVCSKINHVLNHGLFISLFKLLSCHIHWIGYVFSLFNISYLNLKIDLALPKTASSAQTHKSISFIWIVWRTLYVYLWLGPKSPVFYPSAFFGLDDLKNTMNLYKIVSNQNKSHDNTISCITFFFQILFKNLTSIDLD